MFEQVLVSRQGQASRPLAMTISFTGQVAALTAVALISLFRTDSLTSAFSFVRVAAPAGPSQRTPPHTTAVSKPTSARTPWRVFTQPTRVPTQIALGEIETPASLGPAVIDNGIVGGIGTDSDYSVARLIDIPPPAPTPPSKPIAQEKPAAPSAPPKPIAVSQGVQSAKLIKQVKPAYPPLARQARLSGTVHLTAVIGRNGAIERLQLISGHPLLAPAAIEAVKQWLYRPTLLNGEPVEVVTEIDVNFTLSQ